MPGIQATSSIAANATNTNVFANLQYDILPWDATVNLAFQGSATGLRADCMIGSDNICADWAVPLQNRFPIWPDDSAFEELGASGDMLICQLRNTTVGAITHFSAARLTPA